MTKKSDPHTVSIGSAADVELHKTEDSDSISEADVEQHLSAATLSSKESVSAPTPANLKKQPASMSTAPPVQPSQLPADNLQEIMKLQQDIISLISSSLDSKKLMDANCIHFLDTGGQQIFHELLPYFAPTVAVTIFVTKLNELLDDHPLVDYYDDDKRIGEPYYSPLSHKDILRYSFRAIQSHACTGESQTTSPKLLVVGTHRDRESECSESRSQKNKKLLGLICTEFEKSLLFRGEQMEELIFPVNAKRPEEEDHLVAKDLRSAIISVASSLKRTRTPISWHMLEILLCRLATAKNRKVLSKEECLQVAKECHISEDDLFYALEHLHGLLRILYYRKILPNLVFIDPQMVLNKLTKLVWYSHKLRDSPDKQKAIKGKWLEFRNEGVITIDLLETFQDDYSSDLFTPSDLLRILVYRLIATGISRDKYFMPCILPDLSDTEVEKHRVAPSYHVAPLVIYFPDALAPSGVFCALVAWLLSGQVPEEWDLLPKEDERQVPKKWYLLSKEPKCVSRNCISFKIPNFPGGMTLIDLYTHFEVHVSGAPRPFCLEHCPQIRDKILNYLDVAFETLGYSKQITPFRDAFLCEHDNEEDSHGAATAAHLPHPAEIYTANDRRWRSCTLAKGKCWECEEKHLIWFRSSLSSRL